MPASKKHVKIADEEEVYNPQANKVAGHLHLIRIDSCDHFSLSRSHSSSCSRLSAKRSALSVERCKMAGVMTMTMTRQPWIRKRTTLRQTLLIWSEAACT